MAVAGVFVAVVPTGLASAGATPPDLVESLSGFTELWQTSGAGDYSGTVVNADALAHNDEMVVWINNHATAAQQFTALQTAQLNGAPPTGYNEAITLAPALGSVLSPLYVQGLTDGSLDLVAVALETGGVSTGTAKTTFDYPRPYLASDTTAPPNGEPCTNADNATSLQANRLGKPYADINGNLNIQLVPDATDDTDQYVNVDVALSAGYNGLCTESSFPSGHTTAAYQYGVTLATLLPELGPEILTRASEMGINRNILGVHYPLDVMGGRIGGTAGVAAQWADETVRSTVYDQARAQLVDYLQTQCGAPLQVCIAQSDPYTDDPFGGQAVPGGTAQTVSDRPSAVQVFRERMTYSFPQSGSTGLAPSVPAGAEDLLRSTFPVLTDAQRRSVLAQTEIASGYPLDLSGQGDGGSWQRLDLAAAMSATVQLAADGTLTIVSTGGEALVLPAPAPPSTTTVTIPTTVTRSVPTTITQTVSFTATQSLTTTVTAQVTAASADTTVTGSAQLGSGPGSGPGGSGKADHSANSASEPSQASGALAYTGADVMPLIISAGVVLLIGTALAVAGRQRRTSGR